MAIIERSATDFLIFTEGDGLAPAYRGSSDRLDFVELFDSGQRKYDLFDVLTFNETYTRASDLNRSATDTLTFAERFLKNVSYRSASDVLNFSDTFQWYENFFTCGDTLTFTETYSFTISKSATDTLVFTETYGWTASRNFSCSDTLTFTEGYVQVQPDPWNPAYPIPNVTGNDPVVFKYGSTELTFRHYEFGNTESLEFTRVNRRTRGGDLLIGPITAQTETLNFTFNLCTQAQCDRLQKFFRDTLGREIEFKDHEGVWWDGVIMNPDTQKVQVGRNVFTISVQFEGARQ